MENIKAQILDKLNVGVLLLKVPEGASHVKDYIFLYENETACNNGNREYPSSYIGKTFGEIYPNYIQSFPGLTELYPEVMQSGKSRIVQPINYGDKDSIKHGCWGFTILKIDDEHMVILYRDVEDELRIRSAIDSNLAKTRFLSHMSHELRTPMNTIDGMTKLLLKILQDKSYTELDNLYKYVECINNSSKTMINLISDLIDTSAIEEERVEIRLECNDICHEIQECVKNMKLSLRDKNIDINFISKNIPKLYCDSQRIKQIIYNLVTNSIKFTDEGVIMVKLEYNDNKLLIYVKDTGRGIPEKELEDIYERFSRGTDTNQPGSGLGLWIVKKLVELQKGYIKVNSTVGLGTVFSVYIPLEKCEMDTNSQEINKIYLPNISIPKNKKTILLVEDNYDNQLLMKEIFKIYNLSYEISNNGVEALEKLRKNNYNFSCILMDCYMPIMNGYECTLEIRRENTTIPIIGLTASVINGKTKCMQVGMNDFIPKPVDINELMIKLEKYM